MTHITIHNDRETICIEGVTIDSWCEQVHPGNVKMVLVSYHSGDKHFTSEVKDETLASLTKKILAAKNPKPAPKKRK